jgi:hypothetical protein
MLMLPPLRLASISKLADLRRARGAAPARAGSRAREIVDRPGPNRVVMSADPVSATVARPTRLAQSSSLTLTATAANRY